MTWKATFAIMAWGLIVNMYAYHHYSTDVIGSVENVAWYSSEIRHSDDALIEFLMSISKFWEYCLTLGIFTLSFFVNEAYGHWKRVYFSTRAIQGRINDLAMLVTAGAARSNEYGDIDGVTGYQSTSINSQKLVNDVTRMLRLSHAFFWAATPTATRGLVEFKPLSNEFDAKQIGPKLLSREGLEALVRYKQLSQQEMNALIDMKLSPSQYFYVLLEWAMIRSLTALRSGELIGGTGLEGNILRQFTQLRGEYANIGDYSTGRIPMAYVIAVEIIVDILVLLSPLALFCSMGALSIPASGLFTLFFKGLLNLSKSFLDTFGIEGYSLHNVRVDVLVSEVNFATSQRWVTAGDMLPSQTPAHDKID